MKECNVIDFLKVYSGTSIDYLRFGGNWGDALIREGTELTFKSLDIKYTEVLIDSPISNETLIIDGGGNFIDMYSDIRDFLTLKGLRYKDIIILPHTIFGDKQKPLLKNLSNLTVFCREIKSYQFCSNFINHNRVFLWHDMAFQNTYTCHSGIDYSTQEILYAFREDRESLGIYPRPKDNIDLSMQGYAQKSTYDLIDTICKYTNIYTDRLHIAILSTLLSKNVNLYPNSYFKNYEVYKYSLMKYPNIKFKL